MPGSRIIGAAAALIVAGCGTSASQTTASTPAPEAGVMLDDRPQGPGSHLGAHQVVSDYYALLH
ncbi:MAG: hypothetical protein ACREB5_06125, partial [Sphingomonadaceae bacterium]